MAILYEKSLCKSLERVINKSVGLTLKDGVAKIDAKQRKSATINRGPIYLEIAENHLTKVFQEESSPKPIYITPFIYEPNNKDEVAIWIGFFARFDYLEKEKNFELTSISISLIRGTQTKICLLRAEWDSRSFDSDHAQPHWHAIPSKSAQNNSVDERWGKVQSNMHLAMCARWRAKADNKNLSHTHALDEEDVVSWVEKALGYVKSQIEHGLKRFPHYFETNTPSPFFESR